MLKITPLPVLKWSVYWYSDTCFWTWPLQLFLWSRLLLTSFPTTTSKFSVYFHHCLNWSLIKITTANNTRTSSWGNYPVLIIVMSVHYQLNKNLQYRQFSNLDHVLYVLLLHSAALGLRSRSYVQIGLWQCKPENLHVLSGTSSQRQHLLDFPLHALTRTE